MRILIVALLVLFTAGVAQADDDEPDQLSTQAMAVKRALMPTIGTNHIVMVTAEHEGSVVPVTGKVTSLDLYRFEMRGKDGKVSIPYSRVRGKVVVLKGAKR
jgi:hypothetical protein